MGPDRIHFLLRRLAARHPCRLSTPPLRPSGQIRYRHDTSRPANTRVEFKYDPATSSVESSEVSSSARLRNPLDYINAERHTAQRHHAIKKRMKLAGVGLAVCLAVQGVIFYTYQNSPSTRDRLDSPTNPDAPPLDTTAVPIVVPKPGNPDIKVDGEGNELVDTGTSSIPHFPRTIKLPSSAPAPAAQPSATTSPSAGDTSEEYYLLGVGVRTVSFLRVQVYVLGFYVRTTDLAALQAAFVKHVNPLGSSLIPGEKAELKSTLLSADASLDLWDKVLRETPLRSAVRIVPTRSTDFNHLRDGWVTGVTSRTQELAKRGAAAEFEDESFAAAMAAFRALLSGRGKAPKGSTVLLRRDEAGALGVLFEAAAARRVEAGAPPRPEGEEREELGVLADERVGRLVWLGYLGGKNVSSEAARKSIVDGVMELVERPVGTVGMAIS